VLRARQLFFVFICILNYNMGCARFYLCAKGMRVCVLYTEELADAADDISVSVKPSLELKPNSTDEEKLRQSSALAYSFCSDFDLSGR